MPITSSQLDDRLALLVKQFVQSHEELRAPKEIITRSQLAAIESYTDSLGVDGLERLVEKQLDRIHQNLRAADEGKGTVRPKNPVFWRLFRQHLDGELDRLAADVSGHAHNRRTELGRICRMFASRLAIEFRYVALHTSGGDR